MLDDIGPVMIHQHTKLKVCFHFVLLSLYNITNVFVSSCFCFVFVFTEWTRILLAHDDLRR